ncbi:hypothetical protein GF348_24290 [candidate division KSB3 bacterium]|nr:hypothetical protein [candidate division KSB3 bacterium]
MIDDIGPQYSEDDNFKQLARRHQSEFRANVLKAGYKGYGNRLDEVSAKTGLNFYSGIPDIFSKANERFTFKYSPLYFDMLRSEHLPFNFMIPLEIKLEKDLAEKALSFLFGRRIRTITNIYIEWWPTPKEEFLNDSTAFDTYLEYVDKAGNFHAVGIEFKYTEKEYEYTEKEKKMLDDQNSIYWKTEIAINLYREGSYDDLKSKIYKQFFRNHLLGFSMLTSPRYKYLSSFTSVLMYPKGNSHFEAHSRKYNEFLNQEYQLTFIPISFEEFIFQLNKWCTTDIIKNWLEYLQLRYIVNG